MARSAFVTLVYCLSFKQEFKVVVLFGVKNYAIVASYLELQGAESVESSYWKTSSLGFALDV